jgi:hypothetical protein
VDEEAEALIAEPVEALLLVQGAYFGVVCGGACLQEKTARDEDEQQQTDGSLRACFGHRKATHSDGMMEILTTINEMGCQ